MSNKQPQKDPQHRKALFKTALNHIIDKNTYIHYRRPAP
jgi:hypothetical protein